MTEQAIQITSTEPASASVIWLHGLGADGNDFVPVVKMLNLPHIRFTLPHAPYLKITRSNGYEMRAWYDIYSLTPISREDADGIAESQLQIEKLIAQEMSRGIPAERIVLAGFSQGGAIALYTSLRYKQPLAGVLALSTYLPLRAQLATEKSEANLAIPIFMAHGRDDAVITLETSQVSFRLLQEHYANIEWHEYAMEHSVCAQEIEDIRQFLLRVLPPYRLAK